MRIKQLRATNFRNIQTASLDGFLDVNVLIGNNGQGKTNLLEAVYLLGAGGSFRARKDEEMITDGQTEMMASGIFDMDSEVVSRVDVKLKREGGVVTKEVLVDEKKVSANELSSRFPVVLFAPEEVDLIRSMAVRRRRVMDGLGIRINAEYRAELNDYVRIWRHRNQLLLAIKQHRADMEELDVWDEQMAKAGAGLVAKRRELIAKLESETQEKYKTFGKLKSDASLQLKYLPNIQADRAPEYLEVLRSVRQIDIARTHTTRGIHRDDLGIWLGGEDALERASRGEFRSIVLAMKLAEGKILKDELGETPIYLLDDVLSELDDIRRAALYEELGGAQLVITTTHDGEHSVPAEAFRATVQDGKVRTEIAV